MKSALIVFVGLGLSSVAAEFPFAEATIEDLQLQMQAGQLSARQLTAAFLDRIAEVDRAGPKLNAIIELNPDALHTAEQLDAERKAGRLRGPLHGIPVLIKDNIATADEMETTAGSLALVGAKPPRDAHLVKRLREAGAVILGKTNLSEWSNFRAERSVSGWSARGGQTHNPYVLDRSPNGSSSGSAVAVSANLCVAAVGTETFGSIIAPSSSCGIVGLKPTVGRVSRTGIIPIAVSFDTAGPMARTVRDTALLLEALAGEDEDDVATRDRPAGSSREFSPALPAHALKGTRLGVVRRLDFHPNLDAMFTVALDVLRAAGAELIEVGEFPPVASIRGAWMEVCRYELKDGLNAYLATLGPGAAVKSLADLIKFNDEHWAQEQPLFGQQRFIQAQEKGPLTDPAYLKARAMSWQYSRTDGIDALMNKHQLDALVAISSAPARLIFPPKDGDPVFSGKDPGGSGYLPAALAGYPSITVPAAEVSGLPVGLLFYGRAWSDAKLLALAADFEAVTKARREPSFLPTIAVD